MSDSATHFIAHRSSYDDNAHAPSILFSAEDRHLLLNGWKRAVTHKDVGGELLTRLLNSGDSQLYLLLRTRSEPYCPAKEATIEVQAYNLRRHCPRATKIADSMTKFLGEVMDAIASEHFSEENVSEMCWRLGALHHQKRVWLQDWNWIHFHKAFIETVMYSDKHYQGYRSCSDTAELKKRYSFTLRRDSHHCIKRIQYEEILWFKLSHFLVKHIKQGFFEEAMHSSLNDSSKERDNDDGSTETPSVTDSLKTHSFDDSIMNDDEEICLDSCVEFDWRLKFPKRLTADL
ncbi:unnamed protein product [Anisakis simplex]|uniref:GLOBIN domain-containing protein n=1 Tax=Anisakis simplex TaxID=6269 RepID=A0A0M3K2Q9_ANISI|nr:unnamed protein product [Anisakis simplex]